MSVQEGKPIWNESIMTPQEWKERTKKFPGTSNRDEPPQFFKSDFEWRWGMGASLAKIEIKVINERLDKVLKDVGL